MFWVYVAVIANKEIGNYKSLHFGWKEMWGREWDSFKFVWICSGPTVLLFIILEILDKLWIHIASSL